MIVYVFGRARGELVVRGWIVSRKLWRFLTHDVLIEWTLFGMVVSHTQSANVY